jgi:hypothetical protein
MAFGNQSSPEKKPLTMDDDLWYQASNVQNQNAKRLVDTDEEGSLEGKGFAAESNITLEDPNDRAVRLGLQDDNPFPNTDSAGAGIAGGIAGGIMDIAGLGVNLVALGDPVAGNFARGWKATSDWLKGSGSKDEIAYYWKGTIPEGYEEDSEGNLVKKKKEVVLDKGYESSSQTGSGFSS